MNSQYIRESLGSLESFPKNPEPFNEEELIRIYKECSPEEKNEFLSRVLKSSQSVEYLPFSFNVGMFQEDAQ